MACGSWISQVTKITTIKKTPGSLDSRKRKKKKKISISQGTETKKKNTPGSMDCRSWKELKRKIKNTKKNTPGQWTVDHRRN
jgi:hypothetical protein